MVALGLLSAVIGVASAPSIGRRQVDNPSSSDFIRRAWHEAIVLDNYLYIYGGEVSELINGQLDSRNNSRPMNSTLSINLSTSWTNSTVELKSNKGSGTKFYKAPALWKDPSSSSFFTIGGDKGFLGQATSSESLELLQFTSDGKGGGSWSTPQPSNPDVLENLIGAAAPASTSCGGLGLYIGSYVNSYTQYKPPGGGMTPVTGLITYNSTSRAWANESSTPFQSYYGYGETLCLPTYGNNGLVLFLGGAYAGDSYNSNYDNSLAPLTFANLTFYDPVDKKWYWQAAGGDVPSGRMQFCAAVAKSKTGTTEIFMFGGQSKTSGPVADVYVLTIPGFQWFKGPSGTARIGHTCVVAGNRQMISTGGLTTPSDSGFGWTVADDWKQGIGVLDMTALTWSTGYDAGAANFTSPAVVQSWYDNGGLNGVFWSSSSTKTLFLSGAQNSTNSTNTNPQDQSTSSTSSASLGTGAIVGIVIGCLALVGAIAAAYWFFVWRRRNHNDATAAADSVDLGNPENKPPALYGGYPKPELDAQNNAYRPLYELPGAQMTPTELQAGGNANYHEMPTQYQGEPYRDYPR